MACFDSDFLSKSLINLLSNAFKFTPDGGKITVSLVMEKDSMGNKQASISITDNGKGIQPRDIPNIFDRFYQGEVQSNMQQGSGIGLHLVKNLIELHHGTIDVESDPNVFTTFRITLPIDRSAYLAEEFKIDSDQGLQINSQEPYRDDHFELVDEQATSSHKKDQKK